MAQRSDDDIFLDIQMFEEMLDDAIAAQYSGYFEPELAEQIMGLSMVSRWSIWDLAKAFVDSRAYPSERLKGVVHRAMDAKLQLLLVEFELGQFNLIYHTPINADPSLQDTPRFQLRLLSLNQNLIGKSRILWERIMGLIYYLETGKGDIPRSNSRSVRRTFFEFASSRPMWRFLEPFELVIEQFDQRFRTPEFHKRSVLRAKLLAGTAPDANELLELANRSLNGIWDNIMSIVSGYGPTRFTDLHTRDGEDSFDIDPRYLEWRTTE